MSLFVHALESVLTNKICYQIQPFREAIPFASSSLKPSSQSIRKLQEPHGKASAEES